MCTNSATSTSVMHVFPAADACRWLFTEGVLSRSIVKRLARNSEYAALLAFLQMHTTIACTQMSTTSPSQTTLPSRASTLSDAHAKVPLTGSQSGQLVGSESRQLVGSESMGAKEVNVEGADGVTAEGAGGIAMGDGAGGATGGDSVDAAELRQRLLISLGASKEAGDWEKLHADVRKQRADTALSPSVLAAIKSVFSADLVHVSAKDREKLPPAFPQCSCRIALAANLADFVWYSSLSRHFLR